RATVVEYNESKWDSLQLSTTKSQQVVLRLDTILNESARSMYQQKQDKDIKPLRDLHSLLVLWDLAHVRIETLESLSWVESISRNSDPTTHDNEQNFVRQTDNLFSMSGTVFGVDETDLDNGVYSSDDDDDGESELAENDEDIYSEARWVYPQSPVGLFPCYELISQTLLKGHGVYKPIMARLRDAFFLVCKEDMKVVEEALRSSGMSESDIKLKKENDWVFPLKYCR
ncbi:UNVERIFIED_CONTAM: hypothetical protein HDU68_006218, partial [Siphonaria sp. JEL0065]